MKVISESVEETKEFARDLAETLRRGEMATVVALEGDLGAGKTAFSQAMGEALGVRDPIQSPTFLIEKIYELHGAEWSHLIHIDAYRLEDESELLSLGWRAIVSKPENLIIVEWADKIPSLLPPGTKRIVLTHAGENRRQIELQED